MQNIRQCTLTAPASSTLQKAAPCKKQADLPLVALGQKIVKEAHQLQALTSDRRSEEDWCQTISVHVPGAGQNIILVAHLSNSTRFCQAS